MSVTPYVKEIMENYLVVNKFAPDEKMCSDNFDIVIDGIKFVLQWKLTQRSWIIRIDHTWIQEFSNSHGDELSFICKNDFCDSEFFPEFKIERVFGCGGSWKTIEITEELVTIFIDRIIKYIDTLTFDKKLGHLLERKYIRKMIARRCCFGKFMEKSTEKCSVCLDEGIETKTPCGHTLCFPCWTRLEKKPICPECRENISFKSYSKDDDN